VGAINREAFERARHILKYDKPMLQSVARDSQESLILVPNAPLLVRSGWIPRAPLPLEQITLRWEESGAGEEEMGASLEPARELTRTYWTAVGGPYDTYHQTISHIEQPDDRLFFNGSSYRLLDVAANDARQDPAGSRVVFTFTAGRYFDALDTTDVLGFETALLTLTGTEESRQRHPMYGPYREWLGDPFDLRRRCAIPGICTLTVRRDSPTATFILHERDPEKVALSQGVAHVTPAGEFQPQDLSATAGPADLSFWRSICREYAEEFLGVAHNQGQPLDQHSSAMLRDVTAALEEARKSGHVRISYLGVGLDPLTWKPEILTVAVFDGDIFDAILGAIVGENDEGRLIFSDDKNTEGMLFAERSVRHWLKGKMLAAGEACLYLAWHHRQDLGISD
jgi:hypothetical protein